jgi:hypothetical protein
MLCACHPTLQAETASGSATELTGLTAFALVDPDPDEEEFEGVPSAQEIEDQLQERLSDALVARGYHAVELSDADLAVSVDADYWSVINDAQMTGTRSFLGTGTRQQVGTRQVPTTFGVTLDFIDLGKKQKAWRITTVPGEPPKKEALEALLRSLVELVATAPQVAATGR